MNYGIGGLDRDKDVITDIIEEVGRNIIEEEEIIPKGFIYHIQVSSSEKREILDLLDDAEDNGEILAYTEHKHDYANDRY